MLAALAFCSPSRPLAAPRIRRSGGGPSTSSRTTRASSSPTGGIPPDKEAEIQLLLQQRNPSTLKCYRDVLNEKHDRAFKGTVIVLLSWSRRAPSKASDVKIIGGTMTDKEVTSCVIEKLKDFDYPEISAAGHDAIRLPVRTGVLSGTPWLSAPSPRAAGRGSG